MAAFLLSVSSLHTGASIIFLLPNQGFSLRRITFVTRRYPDIQRQLRFSIDNEVDLVAEEDVVLALSSPLSIMVGINPRAMALPLTGAGLLAKAVGVGLQVSGIDGGIAAKDYLQCYCLCDKLVETFVENVVAKTVAEIGEGAI